jgi:hypothetical protein
MILVVGDGFVLHHDLLPHPPSEPADIAELLAGAIRSAGGPTGMTPSRIHVRSKAVAAELVQLGVPGGAPSARARLPGLDRAVAALVGHVTGNSEQPPAMAHAQTWKGWGLSREILADLFHAAAEFWRGKPWRPLENEDLIRFSSPAAGDWTLCVMGNAGQEFGLVMYEDPRDFERLISARSPREGFASMRGAVISLTFDRRNELPPPMRKEILAAGWEIAAPDAYPTLMTLNTPGGGISGSQAGALAAALRGAVRFVGRFRAELRAADGGRLRWRDPDTGAALSMTLQDLRPVPPAPEALAPALPLGPGADPEAAVRDQDPDLLRRLAEPVLREFEAARAAAGASAKVSRRDAMNAQLLVDFLTGYEGVPLAAMTEFDLRVFLHDWCISKVLAPLAEMRSVPLSISRFLGFVAQREGVDFPWAVPILKDRARFEERLETFPGGHFWDEAVRGWQAGVTADLAVRVFLPNDGMAGGGEWGESMGRTEYLLHRELRRRWLLWRDAVLAGGLLEPADVWEELVRRQRVWERQPHPRFGGASPVEAVKRERQAGST